MERSWSYSTRWDIYWPAFAHIGEQSVLNKEIYFQNDTVANNAVYGYQERHAEWRYKPSRVTGLMRSNVSGSLDAWHLAQDTMLCLFLMVILFKRMLLLLVLLLCLVSHILSLIVILS